MTNEIELYARGLALADGTVWGKYSLHYHMARKAEGVLRKIAEAIGSVNGVRCPTYVYGGYVSKQARLTLSGKAWWKHSTEGLDTIHAFRGYIDGDGCWTRVTYPVSVGKPERGKYVGPRLIVFTAERDEWLLPWLRECMSLYRYRESVQKSRASEHVLKCFTFSCSAAMALHKDIYEGAQISMNSKAQVYGKVCSAVREGVSLSPLLSKGGTRWPI